MIRFAFDFRLLSAASKTTWLREEFIQAHPARYRDLNNNDLRAALKRDGKLYNKWKRKVGRMTLARNRLLELYFSVYHSTS
jgi:hypothetical protein